MISLQHGGYLRPLSVQGHEKAAAAAEQQQLKGRARLGGPGLVTAFPVDLAALVYLLCSGGF